MLLSLLLTVASAPAQDCGSTNVALIHDVSAAAMTEWSSTVHDALSELTSAADAAQAKEDAHDVSDRVREAQEVGSITPEDAAKLLDAMSYLWNRADELERGWEAILDGDFDEARDQAKLVADRVRQATEQGYLCEEQKSALLAQAWRLWNLADGLTKAEAASGEESKEKAHAVAEMAREYGSYGQISPEQQAGVEKQAGRIYEVGSNATSPDGSKSIVNRVPYFNQYDNRINPGGSCQNTSIAMALGLYGVNVQPDTISGRYGTSFAQSPEGVASVFNTYASEAGISQRIQSHRDGSFAAMKKLLDQGKPVIVHGYFTGYGHVVVVTGYDENGYYVNDPAGVWSERWKGGYQGSYNGRGVRYGKAAFEQAVGTLNGSTYAPLWYGEVTP
jgi:hypothetical protein